jgi:PadR family transcriptional regulator, regulatory protein PadR
MAMGKEKTGALQGALDLLILRTLTRGPMHGYGIASHIHNLSEDVLRVEEGSLYPALHRIEHLGWIASKWDLTDTNRSARFYRLTAAGEKKLAEEQEQWRRVTKAIDRVLRYT